MSLKRIWAIFTARNYEFFRDRAAFGWNFAFPFLIIVGFSIIFGGQNYQKFKIGVFPAAVQHDLQKLPGVPSSFLQEERAVFIPVLSRSEGEKMVRQHKLDLLLDGKSEEHAYWVNSSSPTGYMAEKLFLVSFLPASSAVAEKKVIEAEEIRYIDWFFPGLLGMNMMFSALYGVGYVVVRYRKNGTLKRLKATPLTPFEFLSAQMLSRIFLLIFTTAIVWVGSDLIFDFHVQGSLFLIFTLFLLGSLSLASIGLVLAARGTSEEFTNGMVNLISWPMMFLSEVWFSLEGSPQWLGNIADILPLKHMLQAIRRVMNEGAGLVDVQTDISFLLIFTAAALSLAAVMFSWND